MKVKLIYESDKEYTKHDVTDLRQFYSFGYIIKDNVVCFYINRGYVLIADKQYLNILMNNIKNSCSLKWTLLNYKNTNNECVYDTIIKRWFKERIKIKEEQLEFIHEDNI